MAFEQLLRNLQAYSLKFGIILLWLWLSLALITGWKIANKSSKKLFFGLAGSNDAPESWDELNASV